MKGVSWCNKPHLVFFQAVATGILTFSNYHPIRHQPSTWSKTSTYKNLRTLSRLRWPPAFLSIKYFLIRACTLFTKHNAIWETSEWCKHYFHMHWEAKLHVTHFIALFALMQWSGSKLQYLWCLPNQNIWMSQSTSLI